MAIKSGKSGFEIYSSAPEIISSSDTIRRGGSIYQSLAKEGLPDPIIRNVLRSLKKEFNPRYTQPGHKYEVYTTTSGDFVKFNYWPDSIHYYTVTSTTKGYLTQNKTVPLEEETMSVSGTIRSSLWEAMSKQGVKPDMIYRFAEIFAWQIDFLTEPRVGDKFKMIWNRQKGNNVSIDGDIVGALYDGNETGKITAILYKDQYYMPDGKSMQRKFLRAPLKYRRISSYFRKRRFHPILRRYRPHHGIDYAAARGTPVSSVGNGKVIMRKWQGGYGRVVKIRHTNTGFTSVYAHLNGFAKGYKVGSKVKQGQIIGFVGSSGVSTGPHLHFELQKNGKPINFLRLKLPPEKRLIAKTELEAFNKVKSQVLKHFNSVLTTVVQPIVLDNDGSSNLF